MIISVNILTTRHQYQDSKCLWNLWYVLSLLFNKSLFFNHLYSLLTLCIYCRFTQKIILYLFFPFFIPQGQILTDGVQLHSEICPETMRKLHERMEELLKEYLSKYGDQRSDEHLGTCYDPTGFLDLNSPEHKSRARKFSSSRRREALKESGRGGRPRSGSYEKSQTLSGSPIIEMKEYVIINTVNIYMYTRTRMYPYT